MAGGPAKRGRGQHSQQAGKLPYYSNAKTLPCRAIWKQLPAPNLQTQRNITACKHVENYPNASHATQAPSMRRPAQWPARSAAPQAPPTPTIPPPLPGVPAPRRGAWGAIWGHRGPCMGPWGHRGPHRGYSGRRRTAGQRDTLHKHSIRTAPHSLPNFTKQQRAAAGEVRALRKLPNPATRSDAGKISRKILPDSQRLAPPAPPPRGPPPHHRHPSAALPPQGVQAATSWQIDPLPLCW